ncbi:MAG: anti-sigma factor antagonist [Zetaproteobacteria bacterium]|nr:MAG: anti-sigma factor antagonist [Zetaproteobacteria bacterium]
MTNAMEIEQRDRVLIVRLKGRLDANAVEEIRDQLKAIDVPQVVMNFSEVSFIDSSGLGLVVLTFRRIREKGGNMTLCGLCPKVRTIFELTRLHRVFDIYDSEELAVAAAESELNA